MPHEVIRRAAGRLLANKAAITMGRPEQSPYWPDAWRDGLALDLIADAVRVADAWLAENRDDTDGPREYPRLWAG